MAIPLGTASQILFEFQRNHAVAIALPCWENFLTPFREIGYPHSISRSSLQPSKTTMNQSRPKALIFDVNETLLDLSHVQTEFQDFFGEKYAFKYWFSLLLQYSLVDTVTGNYHDFKKIGEAVLKMTEAFFDQQLTTSQKEAIQQKLAQLPPHSEVEEGLSRLKEAGFRLYTLTNSAKATLDNHMRRTGLGTYFEATCTVDELQLYKPHPSTYEMVLSRLQLRPEDTMMIAAHGWDLAGAAQVGMQTAFISRQGQSLYPLASVPTLVSIDIAELADQLIAL